MDAPDYIEPLIGYRWWRIESGKLTAPFRLEAWKPGVNKAVCNRNQYEEALSIPGPHKAPHAGCRCGIYAFMEPLSLLNEMAFYQDHCIPGAIKLWGRVEAHPTGYRAEYGQLVALARPKGDLYPEVVEIAKEFGIELVDNLEELEKVASKYGRVL